MTKIEALAKYLECETKDIQDGLSEDELDLYAMDAKSILY